MKTRNILSLVLFCLLLVSFFGTCSAAEISEQDLDKLESNLNQLQIQTQEQDKRYQRVNDLLVKSDKQIQISNSQITLLEAQLTKAEQLINQTQNSLQSANLLLEKQEAESKSKIRNLTFQRDLLIVGLAYMAFKH